MLVVRKSRVKLTPLNLAMKTKYKNADRTVTIVPNTIGLAKRDGTRESANRPIPYNGKYKH